MSKGIMDRFFGTNEKRVPMYIAFMICILVAIIGFISMSCFNMNIWDSLIPIISLAIGYIFGQGK